MAFKKRIIRLFLLLTVVLAVLVCFHLFPAVMAFYSACVFTPFQWLRGLLFGWLPFSLGDILYGCCAFWALLTVAKWLKYAIRFRSDKLLLARSLLKTGTTLSVVYLLFFLGWGANYGKIPLSRSWGLDSRYNADDPQPGISTPATDLLAFDSFLVDRLNMYAPHFRALSPKTLNARACNYYSLCTDTRLKTFGLGLKPTLLGWLLSGIDLEGYYNPFTGEGQFDLRQPSCALPELFTHEIAHQAGIAAEGDANLCSYAVCTASGDSSFCYSAYLNAWQLTNDRLGVIDSGLAGSMERKLNKLTRQQIDTLDQLSKDDDNVSGHYFDKLFDGFLKSQSQKDGLDDYASIATTAWQLEKNRMSGIKSVIRIP